MIDELQSNFKTLITQYPSGAAQMSLLAGKIFKILPECIAVGNGAAELISSFGETLCGKIVVPYPTFNEYPERLANCEIIPMDTSGMNFSYTAKDIAAAAKKQKAGAVLLINPDNPSGNFLSKKDVVNLLRELKKTGASLIFDESFIDFAKKEIRYTLFDQEILMEFPNLIAIKSISKSYGVPGLRLGVLASSNTELIGRIKKKNSIWNINSFAEYFLQIYEKYEKTYSAACDKIAAERDRFIKELSKIKFLQVYPSQANFVLCKLKGTQSTRLAMRLLEKHGIFIKDLTGKKCFDKNKWIRLAIRDERDNNELLSALAEFNQ